MEPWDLTSQEPIPERGVQAALALMANGKLHRYGEVGAQPSEVSALEAEFAQSLPRRFCVGMNSCGSTMFIALKALGVEPGDAVLTNCFTLAPVPGAIAHAGAHAVLVDVTDDLTICLEDLERKAASGKAKILLLSHMRGHLCHMPRLMEICERHGVQVIEDCAHTMGAAWDGRASGTWGRIGCFSLQSYKHVNAGEGGLLVTDDEDVAAQAILYSGSYMLYRSHLARPDESVFERWKYRTPNFSLRMSNLPAALARPQLGPVLQDRARRWNQRHGWIAQGLSALDGVRLPHRPSQEQYVQSSIQFLLPGRSAEQMSRFIAGCADRGVTVKWFGGAEPVGFTSSWSHWRYFEAAQPLPNATSVLAVLCDLRIPLSLTEEDCRRITAAIGDALTSTTH
ncbi:MAG: DegT/DnrJ/EryC1/StrS family aminotransferase [Proteobacteria bacterium]|nr:DegT/DnrJ/EryC1/StrS family aminotransferase [Pseudomonadota bacterium]